MDGNKNELNIMRGEVKAGGRSRSDIIPVVHAGATLRPTRQLVAAGAVAAACRGRSFNVHTGEVAESQKSVLGADSRSTTEQM
ncbi:hypothetical protein J6590_047000 [Homalodisca vitripennis]|nr:hypothetical protein J6590_047000 [Homalodisca vitripennis]